MKNKWTMGQMSRWLKHVAVTYRNNEPLIHRLRKLSSRKASGMEPKKNKNTKKEPVTVLCNLRRGLSIDRQK